LSEIIAFNLNPHLSTIQPKLIRILSRLADPVQVHFSGSPQTAQALTAFHKVAAVAGSTLRRTARIGLSLLRSAPWTLSANRAEEMTHEGSLVTPPAVCSSITLEVTIRDHALPGRASASAPGAIAPGDSRRPAP
jgi:hypothetical protein